MASSIIITLLSTFSFLCQTYHFSNDQTYTSTLIEGLYGWLDDEMPTDGHQACTSISGQSACWHTISNNSNNKIATVPQHQPSFVRTFIRCGALLNHRNNCCHHLYNNADVEMTLHWLVNRQRQTPPEKRQSSASAMLTRTSAVFD